MGQLFQTTTEVADHITAERSSLLKLLEAIIEMNCEIAASQSHSIGHPIEDALLYDQAGWGHSIVEILNHHPAIIMLYTGEMCRELHDELIRYDELLEAEESNVNLIIITPDRAAAMSCLTESLMEDEPQVDDKSNLEFNLEVDELSSSDILPEVTHHYKIYSDVDHNFARKHNLCYTIDSEVRRIFSEEFKINDLRFEESENIIPAIYLTNEDGIIQYAYLSSKSGERPQPEEMIKRYQEVK